MMKIIVEDTIGQYEQLYSLAEGERKEFYRNIMMRPFEKMWSMLNVPLRPAKAGGYDVIMATKMLGYLDPLEAVVGLDALQALKQVEALQVARSSLNDCLNFLKESKLKINADALKFGMYIADGEKLKLQRGYCGFGGIPGFIQISIYPTEYNIPRIPAIIAHEFHHNIRFSYVDWDHGNVTVGDYLVIEGLAESFAKELYGEGLLGPWVTPFKPEEHDYTKAVIKEALNLKGFAEVSSYMFGDEIASEQGFQPVGLSPFAGYVIGYQLVQSFLQTNNMEIGEATLLDTQEILSGTNYFTT